MAFEVVLHLNIILLFLPLFVEEDCFEILCEEVCVCCQVKLKIPAEIHICFTT